MKKKIFIIFLIVLFLNYSFLIKNEYKYIEKTFKHNFIINNEFNESEYFNVKKIFKENDNIYLNLNYENFNGSISLSNEKTKANINNLVGNFNFRSVSKLRCPIYPRLYQLSNYWDQSWLLGGNNKEGKIYIRISKDKGNNWSNKIPITFYPDYVCSNINFYELINHDIIISYRAIGNFSSKNPEIKYII